MQFLAKALHLHCLSHQPQEGASAESDPAKDMPKAKGKKKKSKGPWTRRWTPPEKEIVLDVVGKIVEERFLNWKNYVARKKITMSDYVHEEVDAMRKERWNREIKQHVDKEIGEYYERFPADLRLPADHDKYLRSKYEKFLEEKSLAGHEHVIPDPGHQPQEGASAERDSKKRKLKGPAIASIFTHRQGLGEPYGAAGIGLSLCMPEDSIVGLAMEAAPRRPLEKAAIEENVDPTTLMNANGIFAALRFADEAAGVEACRRREGTARQTRKPEELTLVRVKVNGDDGVYLERVKNLDEVNHVIVYLRQSTVQEGLGNKLAGQAVTIASALLGKSLPGKVSASRFVELGTASRSR